MHIVIEDADVDMLVEEVLVKAAFSHPPANNDYEHMSYSYADIKHALSNVLQGYVVAEDYNADNV